MHALLGCGIPPSVIERYLDRDENLALIKALDSIVKAELPLDVHQDWDKLVAQSQIHEYALSDCPNDLNAFADRFQNAVSLNSHRRYYRM
jgi:predicted glycosyl hydrolase (DUF1957 family)